MKKLLLVDTNIISHALTTNQIECYVNLFKDLEKDYCFGVTGFTKYELMRSSDKDHRLSIEEYIDQNMFSADLSDILIKFAARVSFLYSKHPTTKGLKISDGDIINAAFSIAKDCAILTIDNNDHPRPFFAEINRYRVCYISKASRKETIDVLYMLKPDIDNVKKCFEEYKI